MSSEVSNYDISITSKEELLMPYLTALVNFREQIRKVARERKIIEILEVGFEFLVVRLRKVLIVLLFLLYF